MRSDRPRLPDNGRVGVGKTIEAGLIPRGVAGSKRAEELRRDYLPKALITERKWQRA